MRDWRHGAACRDQEPDLFFPTGDTGPALLQIEEAKDICRACPVIYQCLQWALESGQDYGIWGGLSEQERRSLKRRAAYRRSRREAEQRSAADGAPPAPARKSGSRGGRPLAACGTSSAYHRHVKNREPIDDACRAAHTAADRAYRCRKKPAA